MTYKISGSASETTRILVIEETGWTVTASGMETGSYEIDIGSESGPVLVVGRRVSDGYSVGYGNVTPTDYTLAAGDTGVFVGGHSTVYQNIIEYITISTTGNSTDFGDISVEVLGLHGASNGSNDRGIFGGAHNGSSYLNLIEYITITSPGNASDFGDLTTIREAGGACSNNTNDRGTFSGGSTGSVTNVIDYVTISSTGDATNFGDLLVTRQRIGATSNATNNRGVLGGGNISGNLSTVTIEYITISSAGNSTDWSDLSQRRQATSACSNHTNDRAVWMGGYDQNTTTYLNVIDYQTITTGGNAVDFGDLLSLTKRNSAGVDNGTNDRGVCAGGHDAGGRNNGIEYITISSTGNSIDFGDLTTIRAYIGSCSNA